MQVNEFDVIDYTNSIQMATVLNVVRLPNAWAVYGKYFSSTTNYIENYAFGISEDLNTWTITTIFTNATLTQSGSKLASQGPLFAVTAGFYPLSNSTFINGIFYSYNMGSSWKFEKPLPPNSLPKDVYWNSVAIYGDGSLIVAVGFKQNSPYSAVLNTKTNKWKTCQINYNIVNDDDTFSIIFWPTINSFIGVTHSGLMIVSRDGCTWTFENTNITIPLNNIEIANSGSDIIATGYYGATLFNR